MTATDSIGSAKAELEQQRIGLRRERRDLQRLDKETDSSNRSRDHDQQSAFLSPLEQDSKPEDMPKSIGLVGMSMG